MTPRAASRWVLEAVSQGLLTADRAQQLLPNIGQADARLLGLDEPAALAREAEAWARLTHEEVREGERELRTAGEPEAV